MAFNLLTLIVAVVAIVVITLSVLRLVDARADQALVDGLTADADADPPKFDPAMLDGLPKPATQFFRFSIMPGTPLRLTALIKMKGELSLGTKDAPKYQSMQADQVLSPPNGFVWKVRLAGPMRMTGSDAYGTGKSWSRFRLLNFIPIVRVAQDPDHRRSSFGRLVGEGLFWSPAAFLPAANAGWDNVVWEAIDEDTAAVTVRMGPLEQRAEVTLDDKGQPIRVIFERWSNENADKTYRLQPFGGDLADFQTFGGFRLPTRVTGGNLYGTEAYHPFFCAEVTEIQFR